MLRERILVLDGATGTLLQGHALDEAGFRGERFADHPRDLKGANDLLSLTQPDIVRDMHAAVPRGRRGHHHHQHLQRHLAYRWPTTRWSRGSPR